MRLTTLGGALNRRRDDLLAGDLGVDGCAATLRDTRLCSQQTGPVNERTASMDAGESPVGAGPCGRTAPARKAVSALGGLDVGAQNLIGSAVLSVEPRPRRNWYRYSSEQMSGPLPRTLYKYLPHRYAATMIDRGELMFSTLAWFQNYEDDQRGDRFEGTRKYFPVGGLDLTRTERDGKPHSPVSFKASTESLQSRARGHNHIFIYSTSLQSGLAFDGADACVEIYDPVKFVTRLRSARRPRR
jgi:hypothetical protein